MKKINDLKILELYLLKLKLINEKNIEIEKNKEPKGKTKVLVLRKKFYGKYLKVG